MADKKTLSTNITGLRYTEEVSPGVLPDHPDWIPLEPNSYGSFGGGVDTLARTPISSDRQSKKGAVVDLNAACDFTMDFTQMNTQDLLQGFLFTTEQRKVNSTVTKVVASSKTYTLTSGAGFADFLGFTVHITGMENELNNGVKRIVGINGNDITVEETCADEDIDSPFARMTFIGVSMDAGTTQIVVTEGEHVRLENAVVSRADLNLTAGEWIYLGDSDTSRSFATAANNGFKRIHSVGNGYVTLDKGSEGMVSEVGNSQGQTGIHVWFGTMLKNVTGSDIKKRYYQFERTLGAPNSDEPDKLQAQYLKGSVANELTLTFSTASKVETTLAFVCMDTEQRTAEQGLKDGDRLRLKESSVFNTSTDLYRMKLSRILPEGLGYVSLFNHLTDLTLTVNNNVTPVKALGILGAFEMNEGALAVEGSMTAYFATVEALNAVRENADVSFDLYAVKNNAGFVIDMPLVTLSGADIATSPNEPLTLPLTMTASASSQVNPHTNHTLLFQFFDYLPV